MSKTTRNQLNVFLVQAFFFAASSLAAIAQDELEENDTRPKFARMSKVISTYYIAPDSGDFVWTGQSQAGYQTPIHLLRVLTHPEVAEDLDFVRSQVIELTRVANNLESALEEIQSVRMGAKSDAIVLPKATEAAEVIKEVVLPHQLSRLREIFRQYEISLIGMMNSATHGTVRQQVGLQSKIDKNGYREFWLETKDKNNVLKEAFFDKVLRAVDKKQQAELRELLELSGIKRYPLFLDIESGSEKVQDSLRVFYREVNMFNADLRGLAIPGEYRLASNLKLSHYVPNNERAANFKLYTRIYFPEYYSSQAFLIFLALDEGQKALYELHRTGFWEHREIIDAAVENFKTLDEYDEYYAAEQKRLFAAQLKDLMETLTPQQQDLLYRQVFVEELRALGLSNAIFYGELGNRLKVSPEQKERILKLNEEFIEQIRTKLVKQEEEAQDILLKNISEEDKVKLRKFFGDELKLKRGLGELHFWLSEQENTWKDTLVKTFLHENYLLGIWD
jgi:hypothetical protein